MSNGPLPKLTPNPLSAAQRLAKAQEWTEQPAKDTAQAIALEAPPKPDKPMPEGVTAVTTRFPISVAAQLRYVAGSTYGVTVNSFVVDAVREKLAREKKSTHP